MFTPVVNSNAPVTPAMNEKSNESRKQEHGGQQDGLRHVKEEGGLEVIRIDDSDSAPYDLSDVSMAESEASEVGDSDDEDEQLKAIPTSDVSVKQMPFVFPSGSTFFMHKKSKICHFRDRPLNPIGQINFFECGRKLSDNFERIPSINSRSFRCSLCFKNQREFLA